MEQNLNSIPPDGAAAQQRYEAELATSSQTIAKPNVVGSFSTVISMVENGWDISKALAKLGISRTTFYRKITKEQKCLLDMAKTQNTKYGVGSTGRC